MTREEAFAIAAEYLRCNRIAGAIIELGVHRGESLAQLARIAEGRSVTGVDSFAGLPPPSEHDSAQFAAGQFGCCEEDVRSSLRSAGVNPERIRLIRGFFADVAPLGECALLHLDCDLYESARDGLRLVDPVDGAVVLIDDFFCHRGRPDMGPRRAWSEWLAQTGRDATEFVRYGWHAVGFVVHEGRAA